MPPELRSLSPPIPVRALAPVGPLILGVALALGLASCGDEAGRPTVLDEPAQVPVGVPQVDRRSEPPVPANLEQMGPRVVQRVEAGLAAVRADPDAAAAWGDLGMVLEVRSLRELALVCYEQARLREPDEPRWSYRASAVRWRLGEMQVALADIRRALELAPDYAPAHYRLGTLHFELGELDPAESAFERCTELDAAFAGGWVGTARVLLQRDRAAEAVALLEPLMQRDPSDVVLARLLASSYRQAGLDTELPEPTERSATNVGLWNDPWEAELNERREVPEVHHVLRLLQDGQGAQAARVLERRQAEEAGREDELPLLAEAYFLEGRAVEARGIYEGLLAAEPEDVAARLALARFDEFEGAPERAVERLGEVVRLEPENGLAWLTLARVLYQARQFEAAVPVIRRALELDQRNSELWLWSGTAQLAIQEWRGAADDLVRFLEREPESGRGHLLLARALAKLGEVERAAAELETARSLGSGARGLEKQVEELITRARRRAQRAAERADQRATERASGNGGDGESP